MDRRKFLSAGLRGSSIQLDLIFHSRASLAGGLERLSDCGSDPGLVEPAQSEAARLPLGNVGREVICTLITDRGSRAREMIAQ
jgi:hypothetical protein